MRFIKIKLDAMGWRVTYTREQEKRFPGPPRSRNGSFRGLLKRDGDIATITRHEEIH
jgi:hypothetical protein